MPGRVPRVRRARVWVEHSTLWLWGQGAWRRRAGRWVSAPMKGTGVMTGQVEGAPRRSPSEPGQALSRRGALGEQRAQDKGGRERPRAGGGLVEAVEGGSSRKEPGPFRSVDDLLRDKSLGSFGFEGVDEATEGEKSQCSGKYHTVGPGGD